MPKKADSVQEKPYGAIHNGREFFRRLEENYDFESEGGPLRNCYDFQEAFKCFEAMVAWIEAQPEDAA